MSLDFEEKGYSILRIKHLSSIVSFKKWLSDHGVEPGRTISDTNALAYLDFIESKVNVRVLGRTLNDKQEWSSAINAIKDMRKA
jgi:hypothetical protein